MSGKGHHITYDVAGPTLARFHESDAFWRLIIGPVRSGSSVACCNEIFRRLQEQAPGPDGIRRSRVPVIRNTYGELFDTTMKTWFDWFPERIFGNFNKNEKTHYMRFNDIEAEIMFRALDIPDDVKKLLSLETTFAWVNEAREIPKQVVDVLGDRVGQYPKKLDGGVTWAGVMMDTNPPDTDHWMYKIAEEERPEGWDVFRQPGAILEVDGKFVFNPAAENYWNLNEGRDYYLKRLPGKTKAYIRVYYCAQYGFVMEGKPVHEAYVDATHCAQEIILPTKGRILTVGIDFGLTPAATILQKQVNGQWRAIDELVTERMGVENFCKELKPLLAKEYAGFEVEFFGDPAGSQEAQTDERSPFDILEANGIPAKPAYHNNDPIMRRESLDHPLNRLIDGQPGFLLSPKCKMLRKGLMGGYCFKRKKISGDERYHDKPDKNKYSHITEACEYGVLGGGEGANVLHLPEKEKVAQAIAEGFHIGESGFSDNSDQNWMV